LKIAILTRPGNNSPFILAASLQNQLADLDVESFISDRINMLNRLVSYKDNTLSFQFWLREKLNNYREDRKLLKLLAKCDAVVICECIPNAFWRRLYNVERLKKIIKRPVFFYEVFYLANAPTQQVLLKQQGEPGLERYDGHLFLAPVTEIKTTVPGNAFCIGIRAKTWDLQPLPKKNLLAIVDFAQHGYEASRTIQVETLQKVGIPFISLERQYSIEEIRALYNKASIFFVQFPEAFGLPILECLCAGAQIFTPHSAWPMSWRLDEKPTVHGSGLLPESFAVYDDENDLLQKLAAFKKNYHPVTTPLQIFETFIKYYPAFYNGNQVALENCLELVKNFHQ
jgi:hypothetical protein